MTLKTHSLLPVGNAGMTTLPLYLIVFNASFSSKSFGSVSVNICPHGAVQKYQ